MRSKELFGKEMHNIIFPYNKKQTDILLIKDEDWEIALQSYSGQIKYHYPRHPLIEFFKETEVIFPRKCSLQPIDGALCIFTDGSSKGRFAVYVPGREPLVRQDVQTSAQKAEIKAVILGFQTFSKKFNLYTNSRYVASLFPVIETALLSGHSQIIHLLQDLQILIKNRTKNFL